MDGWRLLGCELDEQWICGKQSTGCHELIARQSCLGTTDCFGEILAIMRFQS